MTTYAKYVWLAWTTCKPGDEYLRRPFPLGTRFAFRHDEHRKLRACFIEYDNGGFVDMMHSYEVTEDVDRRIRDLVGAGDKT